MGGRALCAEGPSFLVCPCVVCACSVRHYSPPASSSGLDIQMTSAPGWGRRCSREHRPGSSLLWTLFSILSSSQQELDRTSSTPPHHDHLFHFLPPMCRNLSRVPDAGRLVVNSVMNRSTVSGLMTPSLMFHNPWTLIARTDSPGTCEALLSDARAPGVCVWS